MNTKRSLTKVFGPVLLLAATLALPMDLAQAAPGDRGDQHEQKNKNKKDKQQENRVRQQRQEPRRQPAVQRQQVKRQKQVAQRQQELQRQEARRLQSLRQQQAWQRQQSLDRQRALEHQRTLERQRALERQRLLERQRQNRTYRDDNRRYDDRYAATPRRGGGGADPNVFHVDGQLDDGGDCLFLRDHEGRTWAMVGNVYGLQPGEHVRLYGRPVDGGACGYRGAAFDIYEVRTVWADNGHKRTYYDHLYDGPFDQNRAYEDDRSYRGQYDPYEDRNERDSWFDRLFGG